MNHHATPAATPHCAGPDLLDYTRYRAAGGYRLLQACTAGHGDGAAVRQRLAAAAPGGMAEGPRQLRVVIDTGARDGGADRRLLERDPHRFIEGLQLACWALGVDQARVLLRAEHRACAELLGHEIELMRQELPIAGLPTILLQLAGDDTADADPAALRCEVQALCRLRAQLEAGLDRAAVAGLQTFQVSGPVREPGLKQVPAGITPKALIDQHCGGMASGHRPYAVADEHGAIVPVDSGAPCPGGSGTGVVSIRVLSDRDGALPAVRELLARVVRPAAPRGEACRRVGAQVAALLDEPAWHPALLREAATRLRDTPACACACAAADALESLLLHFRAEVQ